MTSRGKVAFKMKSSGATEAFPLNNFCSSASIWKIWIQASICKLIGQKFHCPTSLYKDSTSSTHINAITPVFDLHLRKEAWKNYIPDPKLLSYFTVIFILLNHFSWVQACLLLFFMLSVSPRPKMTLLSPN